MIIMTTQQAETIRKKYDINPDGAKSLDELMERAVPEMVGKTIMLPWCGMWVGIEPDGYAHT